MKTLLNSHCASTGTFTSNRGRESKALLSTRCHWAKLQALLLLGAFLLSGVGMVRASDPIGIYALVDKVVLDPNETSPERIQIWGAFAIAEGGGYNYRDAERGYLYYKLNPDKASLCRKEWSDLKAVAGSGQIVTLASRYQEKGTLRKSDAKPEKPDVYPIGMGLGKVREDKSYAPIKSLLSLRSDKPKNKDGTSGAKK